MVVPLSQSARLVQRLEHQGKRLVYYSLSLQCRQPTGAWEDVVRVDCSHCEVHIHLPGTPKPLTIREIWVPEDVFNTYDDAYSRIFDNWEQYERQWSDGRK